MAQAACCGAPGGALGALGAVDAAAAVASPRWGTRSHSAMCEVVGQRRAEERRWQACTCTPSRALCARVLRFAMPRAALRCAALRCAALATRVSGVADSLCPSTT